jgi:hypothetical protein
MLPAFKNERSKTIHQHDDPGWGPCLVWTTPHAQLDLVATNNIVWSGGRPRGRAVAR